LSVPQIHSTAQVGVTQGLKGIVYGMSGKGKTVLGASAPRPLFLSAERGLLSLRRFNLPYINIDSLVTLRNAFDWCSTPKANQFDTLILDSLSEVAEITLAEQKGKTKDGRKAYGDMAEIITEIAKDFRDIPRKHCVLICKQGTAVDGPSGARFNLPAFPGQQLEKWAPYWYDFIFQLETFSGEQPGQIVRALRTQPDQYNQAKDRSGALATWENADPATGGGLTAIFNKMLANPAA
jgi:hypothetical protein